MLAQYYKRLQKKVSKNYQDVSEEEKNKKCQYAHKQYRNLSKEEKSKKQNCGCKR